MLVICAILNTTNIKHFTPILLYYTAQKEYSVIENHIVQKLFALRALKSTYKRIFLLDKHFGFIALSYVNIMHNHYKTNIREFSARPSAYLT